MHVSLQRARQRKQGRFLTGAALCIVGATIASMLPGASAFSAQRPDADAIITGSLPAETQDVPFELRISITKAGQEGIEFAGRLSEDGGLITKPINWKLTRTLGDNLTGSETVFDNHTPSSDVPLTPGDYMIEASYGSVSIARPVKLLSGQHLGYTFVFNVGGLRTLSTVGKEPLPGSARAIHKAYAINGLAAGQLIATSEVPGGLMRLGAGKYRLESEIEPGNTVTHTDVTIKPGILTTIQLDHEAGLATVDAPDLASWSLEDATSNWRTMGAGQKVLTLAPGTYTYKSGSETRTVIIKPGLHTTVQAAH